ncbi:hypothetical protein I4F81_000600 [Pyropia yezoensis]|uniref:Uncharacterized protein n=1 Tax=Pyropia yezoensis TaxID=2788 RepID=A0ACC3BJ73_PYRYE|nr:hypothetical protein I4F81_000600 [Neopyropia yezoensis]
MGRKGVTAVAATAAAAVVAAIPVGAAVAATLPTAGRAFAPNNLFGRYSRFIETVGDNVPRCPQTVAHFNSGAPQDGGGVVVPPKSYNMDGASCDKELRLSSSEQLSEDNLPADVTANENAVELATALFEKSTGFWLGSAGRTCGKFRWPADTTVMFFEETEPISLLLGAELPPQFKYMFVAGRGFTCAYRAQPKTGPSDGEGTDSDSDGEGSSSDEDGLGDLEPSPSDDDSACFPASARVTLADGTAVGVDVLARGHTVRVGGGAAATSEVFLFSHKVAGGDHPYTRLVTPAGELTASAGHYVYANGALKAAGAVAVGDTLETAAGDAAPVTAVRTVRAAGLYAPHTLHGDVVVDGFRVSTYTTAVAPGVAHALLAPVRAAYRAGVDLLGDSLEGGSRFLAAMAPKGKEAY